MRKSSIFLTICLLAICGIPLRSETHYSFTKLPLENGLSSPYVTSMCRDKDGVLWVGTRNGIDCLSPSGHKSYLQNGETINSIIQDSTGNIWAISDTRAYTLNRESGAFDIRMRTSRPARCFCNADEVWICADNQMERFSTLDGSRSHVEFPQNIDVRDIIFLDDDEALIGTFKNGLWRFSSQTGALLRFSEDNIPNLTCLLKDGDTIYASYYGNGIIRYDLDGKVAGTVQNLPSNFILDLLFSDGKLWVATDGFGITAVDCTTSETLTFTHTPGDPDSMPSNVITVILDDSQGGIWAGTTRMGLFNINKRHIRTYGEASTGHSTGLSERCARCLFRSDDGTIWIGTDGQGVNSFNPQTGTFRHFPSTFGEYVCSITDYDRENILIELYVKGLRLMNKKTGVLSDAAGLEKGFGFFNWENGDTPYLCKAREDRLFMVADRVCVHNPADRSFHLLTLENGAIPGYMQLSWYSRDFILIHRGNELYSNNYDDYLLHPLCNVGINGNIIDAGYDSANGRIWVCTDTAFGYFDHAGSAEHDPSFHILPNVPFGKAAAITADESGNVWVSAGNFIYMYNPQKGFWRNFGTFDGYVPNEVLAGWDTEVTDGRFFWCGSAGFVAVSTDLALQEIPERSISMSLREASTRKKHYSFNGSGAKRISIPWKYGTLILDYNVSGIHFYETPEFQFTITGKDSSTILSKTSTVSLPMLAPGSYEIKAGCISSDSRNAEGGDSLSVTVRAPWFRCGIAMVIYILALLAVITVIVRRIINGSEEKKGLVENAITDKDRQFVARLDAFVESNMDKELSSDVLTASLGISRTALFDKVRLVTGYSLSEYIKRKRISKAVDLLKDTDLNINEISDRVGFQYSRYFSSSFKELTGMSPTQFRKNQKK